MTPPPEARLTQLLVFASANCSPDEWCEEQAAAFMKSLAPAACPPTLEEAAERLARRLYEDDAGNAGQRWMREHPWGTIRQEGWIAKALAHLEAIGWPSAGSGEEMPGGDFEVSWSLQRSGVLEVRPMRGCSLDQFRDWVLDALNTARSGAAPRADAGLREALWREMLWLRHGCPIGALYGDDGEMQCSVCLLDFRRMAPEEIQERWRSTAERLVRAALAAAPGGEGG